MPFIHREQVTNAEKYKSSQKNRDQFKIPKSNVRRGIHITSSVSSLPELDRGLWGPEVSADVLEICPSAAFPFS